ncbi:MAG TPA: Stp1/IreP family PP2C-type Ser/Thr phosphatase [Clostridiales bacterium]|nr:Stp1/IreP family PP2C-type Ser/Thr phosphatase [Clostridiales bacterium]
MEYAAYSHKGLQRKSNEDYFYIPGNGQDQLAMMIVADGMGGHKAGELASKLAVEHIAAYFDQNKSSLLHSEELVQAIQHSIEQANEQVFDLSRSEEQFSGMGTTLTLVVFDEDRLHVAHIGDSRCYLIQQGCVRQITRDHSLVQELLDHGSITKDEVDIHPKKNVITRALGTDDKLRIDYFEEILQEGDIVLLCTDGLINYVNLEEQVTDLPHNISMTNLTEMLGNKALALGGSDDITIAAARYTGTGKRGEDLAR